MDTSVIIGAGGYGAVILESLLEYKNIKVSGFINLYDNGLKEILRYPVVGSLSDMSILNKVNHAYIAVGDNYKRSILVDEIKLNYPHIKFPAVINPKSIVSKSCKIAEGTVINAGAVVQAYTEINEFCIVNSAAILEHNSKMEKFSSLAPNSSTGGNVNIGEYSAIGIGATILQNIIINKNSVIGAGSVVTLDIPNNVVAYGVPCKVIRRRENSEPYL